MTPEAAAKRAMASIARHWRALDDEIKTLDQHIHVILDEIAGPLLARHEATRPPANSSSPPATTPAVSVTKPATPPSAAAHRSKPTPASPSAATG